MLTANYRVKLKGDPKSLDKQTTFALATSLTMVAKEAQTAERKEIRGAFTVRTDWDVRGPLAIKVQAATKQNLVSRVGTAAEFLEKFVREPANSIVIKLPRGEFIAIPTTNVRRTKRDIVRASQRPSALKGKHDFLLPMRNGRGFILCQRFGRNLSQLRVLYVLTPRARIRERDVLFGPSQRVFEKRFAPIFAQQMERAFATAR